MNVGLVYTVESYVTVEKPLVTANEIPFGISFVSAALRQDGHKTELLVFTPDSDIEGMLTEFIGRFTPKMFCLTSVSTQFPLVKKVATAIKKIDPSIFVVVGGHHATLNPQDAVKASDVDAVCVGEGERPARELAKTLEDSRRPSGINNLWIKNGEDIEKNPPNPFQDDVDGLPFIDRDIWEKWIYNTITSASILVGRGCPYRCTYCSNHALAKVADGKYLRLRSPENVFDEVRSLLKRWPDVRRVFLEVETFGASINYVFDFCDRLEAFNKEIGIPLTYQTNMAVTDKLRGRSDVLAAMRKAGFDSVAIGLESGSERIRTEILRRPRYSNQTIIEFCETARKYSIDVVFYILIGVPGESLDDFKETISVVRDCQPRYSVLFVCYPYPGTDMFNMAVKMGLVPQEGLETSGERAVAVMDLPGFPRWRIRYEFIVFFYNVYKGKQSMPVIAGQVIKAAILSMPGLHRALKRFIYVTAIGKAIKNMFLVRGD